MSAKQAWAFFEVNFKLSKEVAKRLGWVLLPKRRGEGNRRMFERVIGDSAPGFRVQFVVIGRDR